jgi:hypothetical protein
MHLMLRPKILGPLIGVDLNVCRTRHQEFIDPSQEIAASVSDQKMSLYRNRGIATQSHDRSNRQREIDYIRRHATDVPPLQELQNDYRRIPEWCRGSSSQKHN